MKYFNRGLYIFLVVFYVYALFDNYPFLPFSFLRLIAWFLISAFWNIGVLLITLDSFKKRKILVFFIYFPSIITSTVLLPFKYDILHWGCLLLLITILIKYLTGDKMNSLKDFKTMT